MLSEMPRNYNLYQHHTPTRQGKDTYVFGGMFIHARTCFLRHIADCPHNSSSSIPQSLGNDSSSLLVDRPDSPSSTLQVYLLWREQE